MPLLPLIFAACSAAPEDTGTASPPAEVPPAPELTGEEAIAAIATGTQHGLPDALDLYAAYMGLMALGDPQCPGSPDQLIDTNVPLTGCTAQSGVFYAGVSMVLDEDELSGGDPTLVARLIGGDFTITDAQGSTLDFGGQVLWSAHVPDETRMTVYAQVLGTFVYPGGSPWLAAGVSSVLQMQVEDDGAVVKLVVDGGLGTEGVDLWFDALTVNPSECVHPRGAVQVRDPSGAWWTYDVRDRCDGCGTLSYPGLDAVEVCEDLTGIYDAAVPMLETTP